MKKSLTFYLPALIFLLVVSFKSETYARDTKIFNIKNFNAVQIGSGMNLTVVQSEKFGITAAGEPDDLKDLIVEKRGDVLKIKFRRSSFFGSHHHKVSFNINMPELKRLELSGGAKADIKMNIKSNKFSAEMSGGSYMKGDLKCGSISFDCSGGSQAKLNGSGTNLNVDGSGGCGINLKEFSVKNVNIELSGGSSAVVNMNGKLDADLSGGSRVYYYGKAEIGKTDFSSGSGIYKGK